MSGDGPVIGGSTASPPSKRKDKYNFDDLNHVMRIYKYINYQVRDSVRNFPMESKFITCDKPCETIYVVYHM